MTQIASDVAGAAPLEVRLAGRRWLLTPGEAATVGRDSGSSVIIPDPSVSRHHATVTSTPRGWQFTDHSRNGSYRDGQRVQQLLVTEPTVVVLGRPDDGIALSLTPGPAPRSASVPAPRPSSPATVLRRDRPAPPKTHAKRTGVHRLDTARRTIGRAPDNDLVVDDVLVSRHHAVLERTPSGWQVRDLDSVNGTFVNGQRVTQAEVAEGDLVGVGHARFELSGDQLVEYVDRGDVDIEADGLLVTRDGRRLVDGVGFWLPGRSLLAILGPSGAGKSTLLGALTGSGPAEAGEVRYGGRDLYADYEELRQRIGVVPQDDIVHPQLTVARALTHAARLRFPSDVSAGDRNRRIAEVLDELGLDEQAHQRIDTLSGGQRKRASVALELLTSPSLLFLDEPTSGLDPGLDRQVMHSLRALADGGRTVVVVTHAVLNLDVCDRVIFLAPGGRLAYDGPPAKALEFFAVKDYSEIFLLLEQETSVDWAERLRQWGLGRPTSGRPARRVREQPEPPRTGNALIQFRVVGRRTLDVLLADRLYLVFLGFLPVLLSGLAYAIDSPHGLSAVAPPQAQALLLVLVLGGSLMGMACSVRELVKERSIYLRERAVGLSRRAYLSAKVVTLGAVAVLQAAVFALLALAGRQGPDGAILLASGKVEIGLAILAVTVSSMVVGLAISTVISNADRGMPLLVVGVMLQVVLSGGLFALGGRPGLEQLSWLVPSRWAYAMGAITMQLPVAPGHEDRLWQQSTTTWVTDALVLTGLSLVLVLLVAVGMRRYEPRRRRPAV